MELSLFLKKEDDDPLDMSDTNIPPGRIGSSCCVVDGNRLLLFGGGKNYFFFPN